MPKIRAAPHPGQMAWAVRELRDDYTVLGVATEFGFYCVVGFGHGSPSLEIQANSAALAWPGCQINDQLSDGQFMSWKQAKSCQTTCHLIYVP